jgi:hypothetical protein
MVLGRGGLKERGCHDVYFVACHSISYFIFKDDKSFREIMEVCLEFCCYKKKKKKIGIRRSGTFSKHLRALIIIAR